MNKLEELEAAMHAALSVGDEKAAMKIAAEIDGLPAPGPFSILAAALYYAQEGLHVFPLSPNSKIPHKGTRGCKEATTDETAIRAWWQRWPDSNVGIATGHLVDVVDVDGEAGQMSRARNWQDFTEFDVLGIVLTPRPGGMHLYIPATGEGNRAGIYPSIDHRGRGGYVVAPPSKTEIGTYRWLRPLRLDEAAA